MTPFTAVVRGSAPDDNAERSTANLQSSNRGDLLVAQGLPPLTELVRLGKTWHMRTATASAFDLVAAQPTTLAVAILYNNEPVGGKSYVIHDISASIIVSSAAASQLTLLAQVLPNAGSTATAPTHSSTTTLITNMAGVSNAYDGLALRAVNVTTFVANLWKIVGVSGGHAAANIGAGVFADIAGGIIIPPKGALGVNLVAGTVATAGGLAGITWSEVQF